MLYLAGLSGCPVEVAEESVVLTRLGGVGCLLRTYYHDILNAPSATMSQTTLSTPHKADFSA